VTATLAPVFAALADETRWSILTALGHEDLSASTLATRLPVSRQAIAKHLASLEAAGLVEPVPVGREVRYRALGVRLTDVAAQLERIGTEWDLRLARIRDIAESL
jgi:DNA-binding transcriptional ArsR family regulator